jgi:hypothetical protein
MILAYHRVSSNRVLDAIRAEGRIIPAAYRLHLEKVKQLCDEFLEPYHGTPVGEALIELIDEALAYFASLQIRTGTYATALKCEDILAGDAGRIFLSPGNWSEAGRALGWPLSGFAFDAEDLIQNGAAYRPYDIGSSYSSQIYKVAQMQVNSAEEAKAAILNIFHDLFDKKQLFGDQALRELEIYRLQPGEESLRPDERGKGSWHSNDEIVWEGPLSLDAAVEIRKDDRLVA